MDIYDAADKVVKKNPERIADRGWETSDGYVINAYDPKKEYDFDSMFIVTKNGAVNNFFPTVEQIGQLQKTMPTIFN